MIELRRRLAIAWASLLIAGISARAEEEPEARALGYLAVEVPLWSTEHHCHSCHNNGDAARALYAAIRLGRLIDPKSTADTDRWLARPEAWDRNGGEGPGVDKVLARVQFTAALASAVDSGRVADRSSLIRAADRLAGDQAEDGSWPVEDQGRAGSPATYGRALATRMAAESLRGADPGRFRGSIDRAERWLGRLGPSDVVGASAVLLAGGPGVSGKGRDEALGLLRRGQSKDGGWGPFATSPPEAFDTAIALLALDRHREAPGVFSMIARGRAYLIANQRDDGSWAETTRPPGAESYAQRLSTTGWAALALLEVETP